MNEPNANDLGPILADLGLTPSDFAPGNPTGNRLELLSPGGRTTSELADDAWLLAVTDGSRDDRLAAARDAAWPSRHLVGLYEIRAGALTRRSLGGRESLGAMDGGDLTVLVFRTRAFVMSPSATMEKFDANAEGWNGEPGAPGYAHFRWMRRFVGAYASIPDGARVLDFGSGAGWVGIEAAKTARDVELCAFDPSPEMVRIVTANAASEGITGFAGRVGFGEDPPFPAEAEDAFDVVISSGVLSFSPDLDRWIAGLVSAVRPGGTLVVGDLNPASRGMRRRRRTHLFLPVRELNARTSGDIRARLEAAGFRHEATSGYQLTRPVPQAMHVSETRMKGALSPILLLANRAGAGLDRSLGHPFPGCFDSWVSRYSCARG